MIYTTLNKIRSHHPCQGGWCKLLKHLNKTESDDEPLPLSTVLDSNGLDDCLWCLRSVPAYDHWWRLFVVWLRWKATCKITGSATADARDAAWLASRDASRVAWIALGNLVGDSALGTAWDPVRNPVWNAPLDEQEKELRRILAAH